MTNEQPILSTEDKYCFAAPDSSMKRSPCPALNALANSGYLPRSGENISLMQLVTSVHRVYGISWFFAAFLSVPGVVLCGRWGKLNLDDLALHNRLEHDASLAHVDARGPRSPNHPDPALLERMLTLAGDEGLTLAKLAQLRAERERESKKLDFLHASIAAGEAALCWMAIGKGKEFDEASRVIPRERVREWFGEERLPEGWKKPEKEIGLLEVVGLRNRVQALMKEKAE